MHLMQPCSARQCSPSNRKTAPGATQCALSRVIYFCNLTNSPRSPPPRPRTGTPRGRVSVHIKALAVARIKTIFYNRHSLASAVENIVKSASILAWAIRRSFATIRQARSSLLVISNRKTPFRGNIILWYFLQKEKKIYI